MREVSTMSTKRPGRFSAGTPAPDPEDKYLLTAEAAEILRRPIKTLEYWRLIGDGPPYYRQGRLIRYLRSEVLAWGASHRVANQGIEA
jgi:hypothetical protein